jgi:hypothetical protein
MSHTTRVDAQNQPTMERRAADWITGASRNPGIIDELDGSLLEVYLRKQTAEEATLCMRVYLVCVAVLTILVMWSMVA